MEARAGCRLLIAADRVPQAAGRRRRHHDDDRVDHDDVASPSTTTTSTTTTTVAPTTTTSATTSTSTTTTTVPVGGTAPWSRGFGGTGEDRAQAVAVAGDGSVAVAGYFSGTVDFGGGPRTAHAYAYLDPNSDQDVFVAKYSASGAYLWATTFGTEAPDKGHAVAIAPNGDVVVGGMTSSYLDFGDGVLQPVQGAGDAFVATYRGTDGTFVRGRTFGGTGNDVARELRSIAPAMSLLPETLRAPPTSVVDRRTPPAVRPTSTRSSRSTPRPARSRGRRRSVVRASTVPTPLPSTRPATFASRARSDTPEPAVRRH